MYGTIYLKPLAQYYFLNVLMSNNNIYSSKVQYPKSSVDIHTRVNNSHGILASLWLKNDVLNKSSHF